MPLRAYSRAKEGSQISKAEPAVSRWTQQAGIGCDVGTDAGMGRGPDAAPPASSTTLSKGTRPCPQLRLRAPACWHPRTKAMRGSENTRDPHSGAGRLVQGGEPQVPPCGPMHPTGVLQVPMCYMKHTSRCARLTLHPARTGTVFDFEAWARHRSTARYVRHMTDLFQCASPLPLRRTWLRPAHPVPWHQTCPPEQAACAPAATVLSWALPAFTPHPRSQGAREGRPAKTPVGRQVEDSARPGSAAPGGRRRRDSHLRVRDAARGALF